MYRIWYWATVDRESDGRFIVSIPDLGDHAAYGDTDKDAVARSGNLARVRASAIGRGKAYGIHGGLFPTCGAALV